jgi:anaerobic magnesium-protoporphyrin IX monomethyl ester cyclase
MKVLFVYPDINIRGGALSYHYGIGTLSAVLKKNGHQTAMQYMFGFYNPQSVINKIEEFLL